MAATKYCATVRVYENKLCHAGKDLKAHLKLIDPWVSFPGELFPQATAKQTIVASRFVCYRAATNVSNKGGVSVKRAIATDTAKLLGLSMVFVELLLVQDVVFTFEVVTKFMWVCRPGLYTACSGVGGQETRHKPCYVTALDATCPQKLGWASSCSRLIPNPAPYSTVSFSEPAAESMSSQIIKIIIGR